jgi:hypothetical protein
MNIQEIGVGQREHRQVVVGKDEVIELALVALLRELQQ